MSGDYCEQFEVDGFIVQENGIVRSSDGDIVGRLSDLRKYRNEGVSVPIPLSLLKGCPECLYDEAEGGLVDHCPNCQRELMTQVYAAVNNKQDMSPWIPVTERYPEEEQKVLYYFKETGISQGTFWISDTPGFEGMRCFGGWDGYLCEDVTHWMPLPKAPKDE